MGNKFYADLNRKYNGVVEDWGECCRLQQKYGGLNFKHFASKKEAEEYLAANKPVPEVDTNVVSVPSNNAQIIGCDEVGKVEPFKQLMSVAVYADPSVKRNLSLGDSKKNSGKKEATIALGKQLTDFNCFEDVKDQVYVNDEYGLIYYINIVSNETYNYWEEKNTSKKKYGDALLSHVHNKALIKVYEKAKELGKVPEYFVIDDYIKTNREHGEQFGIYTLEIEPEAKLINDIPEMKIYLTSKCESKYPDTVGAASNIGDYVDQLWQNYCIERFAQDGIDFEHEWFSNFGENAQSKIDKVFDILTETYGSVDSSPIIVKHTQYYRDYMNRH